MRSLSVRRLKAEVGSDLEHAEAREGGEGGHTVRQRRDPAVVQDEVAQRVQPGDPLRHLRRATPRALEGADAAWPGPGQWG